MTGSYIQMGAALAAVALLIVLLSLFLKRKQQAPGLMHVVAYQSIGPKKGVAALRVGGEILLLGVTPTDVRLLRTYDEKILGDENMPGDADIAGKIAGNIADRVGRLRRIKEGLNG